MIWLTAFDGILVAAIGMWILAEFMRPGRRIIAAIVIPIFLAWPVATYVYGSSLLGYATFEEPPPSFELVGSLVDDDTRTVYIFARLVGGRVRLFASKNNFEALRKAIAEAQGKLSGGSPQGGRWIDTGNIYFYDLPPAGLPAKTLPNAQG